MTSYTLIEGKSYFALMGLVPVLVLIVATLMGKGRRYLILFAASLLLTIALAMLWYDSRYRTVEASAAIFDHTSTCLTTSACYIFATDGAIDVGVSQSMHRGAALRISRPSPMVHFRRSDVLSYSALRYPSHEAYGKPYKKSGFTFTFYNEPDLPTNLQTRRHFWAAIIPFWALLSVMCILTLVLGYNSYGAATKYRRKHNLCEKCGYSLEGLTAPITCPECGTVRDQLETKPGKEAPAID